jgi:hypothetical protein
MRDEQFLGNRRILGSIGPNTHRIVTPRGKKECIIALYDEYVPETFDIVLHDRTLSIQAICSYPNYCRMSVDPRFRHISFINFPVDYPPSAVLPFEACPWSMPIVRERPSGNCKLQSSNNSPQGDVEIIDKVSRARCGESPIKGDVKDERALRQLTVSIKAATAEYGSVLSALELSPPNVREGDENSNIYKESTLEQQFCARLLMEDVKTFADWAVKFTHGKLEDMLGVFPFDLRISLGDRRQKISLCKARMLFWVWRACAQKMEEDAQSGRAGDDEKWTPRYVPIKNIRSVIIFPDGSKVYGHEIVTRKLDNEEKYYVEHSRQVLAPRDGEIIKSEDDNFLTYQQLAKRLRLSVRRVKQLKSQEIIVPAHFVGRSVRFCWPEVKEALNKHNYLK